MPINVTCPKCHKRFKVSDKFAGQKGPCPSCKTTIEIPKADEQVVIHAPEDSGPKDASGRSVLKPIFREETKFSPLLAVAISAGVVLTLILALVIRFQFTDGPPTILLVVGAVLLAPPLAVGGYTFLRDQELAPFRGGELWARAAICGAVHTLTWGIFWALHWYLLEGEPLNMSDHMPFLAITVGGMIGIGGAASHFSLDLEVLNGVLHYGLYLGVCVLLRLIIGMAAF